MNIDPESELYTQARRIRSNPDIDPETAGEIIAEELNNTFTPSQCEAIETALREIRLNGGIGT